MVDLTEPDRTTLQRTYFAAGEHWEEVRAAGQNVLTLDFRGYGDTAGTANFEVPPEEGRAADYRGLAATARTPCGSQE